jgi:tetratricopeptide (TPR) repeat protein
MTLARFRRCRRAPLVALAVALTDAGVWSLLAGGSDAAPDRRPAAAAFDNTEARPLGQSVGDLQRRLRADPGDWRGWARLGFAYLEEARVSDNPALYPKAEGAFGRSLDLEPADNFAALAGRGALANARHDFASGLDWGDQARSLNPSSPEVHAVVGDALLELGRYDEAFAAYQKMVDLAPGVASYTRASYALELQGNVAGARRALELALGEAIAPKDLAFAHHSLGELAWNTGEVEAARRHYEEAIRLDPDLVPARAGVARLHAATGEGEQAAAEWEDVVARAPLPEYVAELGTLHLVAGRPAEAEAQFDLLDVQRRLLEANGVKTGLELALFSADHGVSLSDGLRAAREEWRRRQSIHVADALAWQLHAHGADAEALALADEALRLGTRNALFHFHRGMIQRSLGNSAAARRDFEAALSINPHFSLLHAPAAAQVLAELRGG